MKIRIICPLLFAAALLYAQPRKDFAVFFPVTKYTGGWTQLPATLSECNDLAGDLSSIYGFETTVLPEKTKPGIKIELGKLAIRNYGPDDQLLLVFSMHGYFDEAGEAGCLCPAGAKANDDNFDTWLLHSELRTLVARIPCEHILVVLDACYSGTFGGKRGKPDGPIYKETPDCRANIEQALARKTRYYIAAGGKERVPNSSELVKKIRSALGGRNSGDDGILSLKELLAAVSEARPTPKDGEFTGDLGGGFVFVPKSGCAAAPTSNDSDDDGVPDHADKCPDQAGKAYLEGCPETDHNLLDDGLVFVKGGAFTMGCINEHQDCESDEKPPHQVTLNDFYIGRYEVTQQLWLETMGSNPSHFKSCDNCPVENVSWHDVQEFLEKLNAKHPDRNYRLPTEAEWEYAARGGGKRVLFGNGKNIAEPAQLNFDASAPYKTAYSVAGGYRNKTVPVGSLNSPNALGLYDMAGNVWEWCSDWYGADYYKNSPSYNPNGPASGSYRVARGGSWLSYPRLCRAALRYSFTPGNGNVSLGFRLAR